jgi:hypothetical protein
MGRSQRMSASISILVDRSLAPQITSNGIFLEGRTQYITFKFLVNKNLTIVNIYDIRTFNEQALIWKRLSEANFDTSHVIIRRNFNHLEETNQRGKVGKHFTKRRKVASWHHMTLQYGLADIWKFWKLDIFQKMSRRGTPLIMADLEHARLSHALINSLSLRTWIIWGGGVGI